jgi:cbb3-type cytochrome oxidase cytochrome c subunit
MKYGPLIFLAAFFALASSWVAFVMAPQMQVGQLQQTNAVGLSMTYPVARPGLAHEGLEVYRANGCQYCHSQQVGQTGTTFDVALTEAGTNQAALLQALLLVNPGMGEPEARQVLTELPKAVRRESNKAQADAEAKSLSVGGAKAQVWVVPTGPDIERGWGKRRSVAEDYLFDYPVMLGSRRVGPDLANVGLRQPNANWHLLHLYEPRLEVPGSTMPNYRFLFQKRKLERAPSPDALGLPHEPGYELVPTAQAKALTAYLLSLRADAPLFDAPFTVPAAATPAGTNAAATAGAASTNAPATNAPAK